MLSDTRSDELTPVIHYNSVCLHHDQLIKDQSVDLLKELTPVNLSNSGPQIKGGHSADSYQPSDASESFQLGLSVSNGRG